MELTISLQGNPDNPIVEIGNNKITGKEAYNKGPLYAFYVSIPHCIFKMVNEILQSENREINVIVRARYKLKEKLMYLLGQMVIDKIVIEIVADSDDDEYLSSLVEKVKTNCPIYLSLKDRMSITYSQAKTLTE